jgi:hypothetical protein
MMDLSRVRAFVLCQKGRRLADQDWSALHVMQL